MAYRKVWGCGGRGKIVYTRSDALRAVQRVLTEERDPANVQGLNAYRCRECGRWHLGHSVRKIGAHVGEVR